MIYNSELNIYSDTDSNNSREIKVLQDAVNVLEHQVEELETDVSGLSTEVDTAKVKAVNGEITSLTVENETVNKITATGDANFATLNATDLNASVDATLANATVMGDLRVNGVINGTLAEYNIEDLEVENLKADYVEMNGNINMKNHFLGSASKLGTNELVVNGNALFNDSITTQKGSLNWGKVGIESETGEVIALYTDGLVKAIDIEAETLDLSSNAEIGGNLTVGTKLTTPAATINGLSNSRRLVKSDSFIYLPPHSTGDDNFIEIKPFNGTYNLRLIKDGTNPILSITITETNTNNGSVYAKVSWSADDRTYLKKIELLEDGNLYFRTFGDGSLYYSVDTVDMSISAPETYYAVRPTTYAVADSVDVLYVSGNATISSQDSQGSEGGEGGSTETVFSAFGEKKLVETGYISEQGAYDGIQGYNEIYEGNILSDASTNFLDVVEQSYETQKFSGIAGTYRNRSALYNNAYEYLTEFFGYGTTQRSTFMSVILGSLIKWAHKQDDVQVVAKGTITNTKLKELSSGTWKPKEVQPISTYGEGRIIGNAAGNTLYYILRPTTGDFVSALRQCVLMYESYENGSRTPEEYATLKTTFFNNFEVRVVGSGQIESEEEIQNWDCDDVLHDDKGFGIVPGWEISVSGVFSPFAICIKDNDRAYYKYKKLDKTGYSEVIATHIKEDSISYWTAK